jgi:ABC-2 type transport system permease protein
MTGAFWFLMTRMWRNRVVVMARRVKQPRYAIGLLFVVVYFGFLAWGQVTGFGGESRPSMLHNAGFRAIGPALIALMLLTNWIGGGALSALAFSQPEVHMLFPAPVSRRALIVFKLARGQLPILFNVLIMMVLWGGGKTAGISRGLNAVGLYTLFATMYLHRVGAALVLASTMKHGRAGLKRNWVTMLIVAMMFVIFMMLFIEMGAAGRGGSSEFSSVMTRATDVLATPWIHALLTPFRLMTGPAFARTTPEWFAAFAGAAVMLGLHAIWVLRSQTAFEEAAAEQSEKLRAMTDSWRKRGFSAPPKSTKSKRFSLPLSPLGHPAVAIVWKNSLNFLRNFRVLTWMLVLMAPVIVGILTSDKGPKSFVAVAMVSVTLASILLLVGGIGMRNDLRGDLQNLSAIKTIPMRGSTIVLAEVVSSALPLALIQSALLWIAVGAMQLSEKPMPPTVAITLAVTLPLGAIGVNIVVSTIRNSVAVLFPAWVRLGGDGDGGIEVMGQSMLSVLATMIGFLLLMIAPTLVTLAIVGLLDAPPAIAIASSMILGAATTIGESHLVSLWIGRVLDRTEPSASLTAA